MAQVMSVMGIQDWCKQLGAIPEAQFTYENVGAWIRGHKIDPDTLQPYLFFSKGCYTRNLIFKSAVFEVMAICWEPGQFSRIHNHRDQNCWMAVPIGRLRVQNFRVEKGGASSGICTMAPTDAYDIHADNPGFVDPAEPVHQVLNLPEFGARAVSVHVYSRPFDSCEIYQREDGRYFDVPLHYTSEYGKLNPDEKLI